jgi:hypothetical protein
MFVLTTFVIAYHRVIKSSRTQPRNILSHWNQIHTIAIISLVPHLTTLENCRRATPGKRCRRYLPPSLSLSLSLSLSFSLSLPPPNPLLSLNQDLFEIVVHDLQKVEQRKKRANATRNHLLLPCLFR